MGTKQKVLSIKGEIHKLEKQVQNIQKNCSHKKKSLKFVNLNMGVRWFCDDCDVLMGVPSGKEVQKWIDK